MKSSALGLAIAAIAFGASTIYLSVQLNEERAQADKAAETMAALNARIAELEKVREQRFAMSGEFGGVALAQGGMAMGPPPPPTEKGETKTEVTEAVSIGAPPPRSEAFEKMMRTNMRANNKRMYADIGEKLGLNKEDTSRLIDMLTDQQVDNFGNMRDVNGSDPAERKRLMDEARREDQAEIEDFLGASKAAALRDYQETIPSRQELEQLARQLEGSDATLSDEQQKRMLTALIDERKRIPMPQMSDSTTPEEYTKALRGMAGRLQRTRQRPGAQHPRHGPDDRVFRLPAVAEGNAAAHGDAAREPCDACQRPPPLAPTSHSRQWRLSRARP